MSKILILMSVYNGALYLSDQIKSIQAQTEKNWQLLIRDDASHDGSLNVINYFEKIDSRINLFTDTLGHLGVKHSFHQLIIASQHINAQYYAFADQDDVWDHDKLEQTVELLETQSSERLQQIPILAYTDLKVVDKNLKVIDNSFWHYQRIFPQKNTFNRLLLRNMATGCTMLFNQKLRNMLIEMPESAVIHDWWAALITAYFGKLLPLPRTTMSYRQHAKNVTGSPAFNIFNISKILQSKNYLVSRNNAINQAHAFLYKYNYKLNIRVKSILKILVKWRSFGFMKKAYYMFKYRLFHQGLLRNFAILFFW